MSQQPLQLPRRAVLGAACLAGGAALLAGLVLPLAASAKSAPGVASESGGSLPRFRNLIGSRFEVESARRSGAIHSLVLQEVTTRKLQDAPAHLRRVRVTTLLFQPPPGPHLDQDVYTLRHADAGMCRLLLVPVGPFEDGYRLEAVIA